MNEHENAARGHATAGTYLVVAAILTVITVVEVGVYYVPSLKPVLAPTLIVLSASKFALVVMFYMHLRQDHRLFSAIFVVPLMIAVGVAIALLFLFGVLAVG
ncbi:MAG TPA: cytochrome C oxidase subunit IV family protein [Gemmatimonadales bacterium]|jgi:cytochrome c oxidase subunit 4